MKSRLKLHLGRQLPSLAASLFGLCWFAYIAGGWKVIVPTKMDWLLVSDWGAHQVGWLFFRTDPWRFPLGSLRSVLYPVGSTLGYSDSIPILGLIGKILSPVLPNDFQYIGAWLASCFALQGYVGAKIATAVSRSAWGGALGGALFVTTPTLVLRVQHPSLCAHWLVLSLILLHLKTAPNERDLGTAALLTALSGMIHPYLSVMVLALSLALLLRVKRVAALRWSRIAAQAIGFVLGLAFVFWAFGYVGTGANVKAGGFDYYSADLNALFNPMGYSRRLGQLPHGPGAYEGLAYLGTGVVGLAVLAALVGLPLMVRRRARWHAVLPLATACLLLAMLAASSSVRYGGRELLNIGWVYEKVQIIVYAFRSTGRFIWPLHYLCIAFALAGTAAVFRRRPVALGVILLLALVIQVDDTNALSSQDRFRWSAFERPKSTVWNLLNGDYEHVAIYPPQIYGSLCGVDFDDHYVYRLSYIAYRLGLTINSGYVARYSTRLDEICGASDRIAERGADPRTVYILTRGHEMPRDTVVCGPIDGFVACVAAGRSTPFSRALAGR